MIACGCPDIGDILIFLVPIGICYLCSMYDVLLMICDKQKNFTGTVIRNVIVLGISLFYLALLGRFDPAVFKFCGIPILVSICAICSHYFKEFEPSR